MPGVTNIPILAIMGTPTTEQQEYLNVISNTSPYIIHETLSFDFVNSTENDTQLYDTVPIYISSDAYNDFTTYWSNNSSEPITTTPPMGSSASTSIGVVRPDGLYIQLDASYIPNLTDDTSYVIFRRNMFFRNDASGNYVKSIIESLAWEYTPNYPPYDVIQFPDGNLVGTNGDSELIQVFQFYKQDILLNTTDGIVEIKILDFESQTNSTYVDSYLTVFNDLWDSTESNQSTYIVNEAFTFLSSDTDTEIIPLGITSTNFTRESTTIGWGDSHIQTLDGKIYKLPDIEGVYTLLENSKLGIYGHAQKFPNTRNVAELKNTTFFSKFTIDVKNTAKIEIDMKTLSYNMCMGTAKINTGTGKYFYSLFDDACLRYAIEQEKNMSWLSINIGGIRGFFIKLPSRIDIQNIALFDIVTIEKYMTTGTKGAMIDEKQLYVNRLYIGKT
jgi:hypothetical protein